MIEQRKIMFDLDGTLLPMDTKSFVRIYFGELAKKASSLGYDGEAVGKAIMASTQKVVENNGKVKNDELFWQEFTQMLGNEALELREQFDKFYDEEFHKVKEATSENNLARKLVDALKENGKEVLVATNPVFPMVANRARLGWINLKPEDFSHVTAYENSSFCKPNLDYYREILQKTNSSAEEWIMVGNDVDEDMVAAELGMDTFLVTDCLLNRSGKDISEMNKGSFAELLDFLGVD